MPPAPTLPGVQGQLGGAHPRHGDRGAHGVGQRRGGRAVGSSLARAGGLGSHNWLSLGGAPRVGGHQALPCPPAGPGRLCSLTTLGTQMGTPDPSAWQAQALSLRGGGTGGVPSPTLGPQAGPGDTHL